MAKEKPDHHDADIVLRLYEMRREEVMRQSRNMLNGQFWPKNYDDVAALMKPDNPMNAAFRQVSSFWEMVYGMAVNGIVNAEYLMESSGEGLYFYAKIAPYIEQLRKENSPTMFRHTEWVSQNTEGGKQLLNMFTARFNKMSESK
jgi:hypothetical protein